jgi:Kef-type K+ transport system membrane component KefB
LYAALATEQLFVNVVIILVAARLLGELFQRFNLPSLVGELLAGVVIGPSVLSLVKPTDSLTVLSDLGVFFLMFLAGLEMDPREIRKAGSLRIFRISFGRVEYGSVNVYGVTNFRYCCSSYRSRTDGIRHD